ncbi:MAG: hypothetical protein WB947_00970 [Thermoplasmata archaeon]
MSESTPAAGARAATLGFPSAPGAGDAAEPPRAGTPNPRGSFAGRASEFRQRGAHRRFRRLELLAEIGCVALIVVAFTVVLTAKPPPTPSPGTPPWEPAPSSAPITVRFGTPTVGNVSCGAGGTAYTERIPWLNSSQPVTTASTWVILHELGDGDYIPDPNAVANATPASVCAGAPPSPSALWYVVLAAPNGTNLLTYTEPGVWASVTHGSTDLPIAANSSLVVVTDVSIAGTGRGLAVLGYVGTASISGNVPL